MKELIRFGTQFVGYREYAAKLEETLAESNKRVDALSVKLEQSENARKKAEADAAAVEGLRKRLHDTETSLSDNIVQQSAREKEIITRLESQSRRFVRKTQQDYELESPEGDPLLDALSLLEIHGDEAREGLAEAGIGLSRLFPYFFKKKEVHAPFVALAKCFNSQENLGLQLRQEGLKVGVEGSAQDLEELRQQLQSLKKQSLMIMEQSRKSSDRENIALRQAQNAIAEKETAVSEAAAASARENFMLQLMTDASLDMTGSFLDTAAEDQRVEARSNALLTCTADGSNFWVYDTMFPRNKMPETLPDLMEKFRDAPRIHGFVRAQLSVGARFAMMMIKICYPKFDLSQIVTKCLAKMAKKKRNVGKIDDIVTPIAEDMMDELLRMDAEFFVKGSYAEHSTRASNDERLTIDNILDSN
ncbi:hypothetical protein QYE76_031364 [Lolium multiflorum]|uniref:FRIGIDA-like protein n=1 Tax=Lolium multiflorum TaxID=4521 RepID=A0AAD8QT23_LOLMU|nr:hypothetical protein QYE76_031364 [Lolium multiflorum]